MKFTFTIDTDHCNDPACPESVIEDLQCLFKFLCGANPNYYMVGGMLLDQIKEQVPKKEDPVQKMQERFCDICDEADLGFTAWDLNERHGDEPVPGYWLAWDNFIGSIGKFSFPEICCFARTWKKKLEAAGQCFDWVDKCLDVYETEGKL